jgi:hypothetical protein
MPDPPIFHAQGRIFAFENLDGTRQKEVKDFEKLATGDLAVTKSTAVNRLDNNTSRGTPDTRSSDQRYLDPDHPGGQPTIPQSDWKRVNCVVLDEPVEVARQTRPRLEKQIPCDLGLIAATDGHTESQIIQEFYKEFRSTNKCAVLIVRASNDSQKRTIAGFNNSGEFGTVVVDDPKDELSITLNKEPDKRGKIVQLATLRLGLPRFQTLPVVKAPDSIRTSYVSTAQSIFPDKVDTNGDGTLETVDPFANPPGTNMLPTVFSDIRNTRGREIVNTLPSTKARPYNLHEGQPTAVRINPESPSDDLKYIMTVLYEVISGEPYEQLLARSDGVSVQDLINDASGAPGRIIASRSLVKHHIKWALDIIEGNNALGSNVPVDRAYRGFPLFNHSGHRRVKRVMPMFDAGGKVSGGEVTIRQLWYGGRIQSDTMFLDFGYQKGGGDIDYANCGGPGQPSDEACRIGLAPIPPNKPWKVNFEIYVLNKGNDDFSPMTMHFDCPSKLEVEGTPFDCPGPEIKVPVGVTTWSNGPLYASLDQSFFPMTDGTRVDLTLKMAPPQFYNLTYTWGWRVHPPRAQAVENGEKVIPPPLSSSPNPFEDILQMYCHPLRAAIIEHERWAFEGFTGPSKLPDEVRALPPAELFAAVQQLAKIMGLSLPSGTPAANNGERFDACFNQFKTALASQHFREAGAALQARCNGRPPNSDNQITPPDMMDARLCLLTAFFPAPAATGDYDPAIDKISDVAPVKRMWRAVRAMRAEADKEVPPTADRWIPLMMDLRDAYLDWLDRTHLPSGVQPDPKSDLTLLYANNTIYGQLRTGGYVEFPDWRRRGDFLKVTLLNGDYFPHGYLNVDFGGARGWENLWRSTIKTAGSGPWFTFGRFHSRFNTVPGSIAVGPARLKVANADGEPKEVELQAHRVMLEYNFEPTPRLRFYQFDPLHHDAAIYSIH